MRDVLEIFRSMKRRKGQLKVCPQCGSSDIEGSTSLDGFVLPARFLCKKCGYSGHLILEAEDNTEKEKPSERT